MQRCYSKEDYQIDYELSIVVKLISHLGAKALGENLLIKHRFVLSLGRKPIAFLVSNNTLWRPICQTPSNYADNRADAKYFGGRWLCIIIK